MNLQILDSIYLPLYIERQSVSIKRRMARLRRLEPTINQLQFLVASAIFSANIDGNTVDFNSYYCFQELNLIKTSPLQEVENLVNAYRYASQGGITEKGILTAYQQIIGSRSSAKADYRNQEMGIWNHQTGQRVYQGTPASQVREEMQKFLADMSILVSLNLSDEEVFYYAAQLHLQLAHIMPFPAYNGLMARLVEKWFLAEKLGDCAWSIQSERGYQQKVASYFSYINIGATYHQVDYQNSLPFLLLLPQSLKYKPIVDY